MEEDKNQNRTSMKTDASKVTRQEDKKMITLNIYFLAASLILSMIAGYWINRFLQRNHKQILYISQEEVMDLEKKRIISDEIAANAIGSNKMVPNKIVSNSIAPNVIPHNDFKNKKLFFGKPIEAAKLVQEYGDSFRDDKNMVIYSVGKVVGDGAKSISAAVHDLVIKELQNESR